MRFVVLGGGGAQGRLIVEQLAGRPDTTEVVAADVRAPPGLPPKARGLALDALDAGQVARAAKGADVAVTALPGPIGLRALGHLLAARVPVVDLAFTPEAPYHLDAQARDAGVPVVVDCGVAPGLSHILAAKAHRELGGLDALTIYVGGLPLQPPPGFHHAVYFHPRDLLEEYIRPARMRVRGKDEAPAPLDAPVEALHDAEVGPLEAFLSDGLRSLLASFPDVPEMVEKTLRIPGHLEAMRTLRALGLLEGDAATDAVAKALGARFPAERFPDRLLMEVWGQRCAQERRYRVHTLRAGAASAMARSTGGTAAAAAVLLARGGFRVPGVHAPERLGMDAKACEAVLADLAAQGMSVESQGRLRPA